MSTIGPDSAARIRKERGIKFQERWQLMTKYPFKSAKYCGVTDSEPWFIRVGSRQAFYTLDQKIHHVTGAEVEKAEAKLVGYNAKVVVLPENFLVLPTGFDLQTHLRYPGQEDRETLTGGLLSAFAGGYDTVCTMPNTNPFLDNPSLLRESIENAREEQQIQRVKIVFTAAGTEGIQGEKATDIMALKKAGAVAITDDGWGVKSSEAMRRIFELCAAADIPFLQHAEMPGHGGHATSSAFQRNNGIKEYPRTAESEMVRRDVDILRDIPGARYHVLHISTKETLQEVRRAKDMGLAVTCEVTPHHLIFSNADIPPASEETCTSYKMNPPLFAPEDRTALQAALQEGLIDCVSTDHAPHRTDDKQSEWSLAPFGTRGLVTALSALTTLVQEGKLSVERLEQVWSTEPRKIAGIVDSHPSQGLLFVDPDYNWVVDQSDLPGISRNSCFLKAQLKGRIMFRAEVDKLFKLEGREYA